MLHAKSLIHYFESSLGVLLSQGWNDGSTNPPAAEERLLALAAVVSKNVEVYSSKLDKPISIHNFADFDSNFPFLNKSDLIGSDPKLSRRVQGSELSSLDLIHVSSGSGGVPTFWGHSAADELIVTTRFEQIFRDAFNSHSIQTLAVVALPMGSWVGGLFTTSCVRVLAQKGYKITLVTPGNNAEEILRIIAALSPQFEQTVILGYPPFVKGIVDLGNSRRIPWGSFRMRFVFAGEVFSEEWRALVGQRAGVRDPLVDIVSIYGTADAGVLANETPISARVRRFLAANPSVAHELFGRNRIPSLMQYDPLARFLETRPDDHTIALSTMPFVTLENPDPTTAAGNISMPLCRYSIGDAGGIIGFDQIIEFVKTRGFDVVSEYERDRSAAPELPPVRRLPFVWVFGRAFWTVSLYGANVYVENIMVGLEQEFIHRFVTGKFVLAVNEDPDDTRLLVRVELAPNVEADESKQSAVADSLLGQLKRLNSEYANYVPVDKQTPMVVLYKFGDPSFFPLGVKHSYI
ncbi:hypothetical protein BJ742DRAFT_788013 [Cladochytrium replicatum]|nr:hypothetical protein BJ742DRAFT_788013 [Cladochytrium replicatum]